MPSLNCENVIFPPIFLDRDILITKSLKKGVSGGGGGGGGGGGVVLFGVCSRVVHFWRSMTCSVFVCLLSDSCMHVQGKHC